MSNKEAKKGMAYYESTEGRNYLTYIYRDLHYTDKQAAEDLGITSRTIINWRKKSSIIDRAIEVGKAHTDTLVENSLLQQALKGNVEACKYWLQNRKPSKWKANREDKQIDQGAEKERQTLMLDLVNVLKSESAPQRSIDELLTQEVQEDA